VFLAAAKLPPKGFGFWASGAPDLHSHELFKPIRLTG
jgi:hypothetical protein